MPENPDGLPYPFRQASWDYGMRGVAPKGVVLHMAEGLDVGGYLSQRPNEQPKAARVLRGVSATFCVQPDGAVIQELRLDHTSGSLNPRDVRDDDVTHWGRRFTRYLGPTVTTGNANRLTISIETSGFAGRDWNFGGQTFGPGPNPAQVQAIKDLVGRLRDRFHAPLGFNGHADFADYKICPGRGDGIMELVTALGHGQEMVEPPPPPPDPCDDVKSRLRDAKTSLVATQDDLEEARQALVASEAGEADAQDLIRDLLARLEALQPEETAA